MPLRDDLHRRRDRLMAIAARHGASNLRLFGSVSRGEEGTNCDIDLLVDMAEDRGFSDYLGLVEELEGALERRVDVVIARSLSPNFRVHPRRGGAFVKSDLPYLGHIADSIAAIENYVAGGRDALMKQRLVQDAVIRNFEVIGEAATRLSPPVRDRSRDVWSKVIAFRNRLIHGYWSVDLLSFWDVVENDLPRLKTEVASLLASSLASAGGLFRRFAPASFSRAATQGTVLLPRSPPRVARDAQPVRHPRPRPRSESFRRAARRRRPHPHRDVPRATPGR